MSQLGDTYLFNDTNLVSYYKLEDVNDSKSSNNLTNINSVTFSPGKFLNAADLGSANTNKALSGGSQLNIDLTAGASWVGWFNMNAQPALNTSFFLIQHYRTPSQRYFYIAYSDTSGVKNLNIDPSGGTIITYNTTLATGTWNHLVITYTSGNAVTLYLNGVSVATGTRGSSDPAQNIFYLGVNQITNGYASCMIDDVAIFSRALTATEALFIYQNTSSQMLLMGTG